MQLDRGRTLLRIGSFLAVLACGAALSSIMTAAFSSGACTLLNAMLGPARFEKGVRVELEPLPASHVRQPTDNVDADTRAILRVDGYAGQASFGLSLRRDVYLPLFIFLALILALPLRARQKAACLAIGVPLSVGVAAASIHVLVTSLLAEQPATRLPSWQASVARFLFERWLTPPGNRVIAPLLLALALAAIFWRKPVAGPDQESARRPNQVPAI